MIPVSSDDELWKSGKSDEDAAEANEEEDSTLDLSSPSPDDEGSDDLDLSPLAVIDKESSVDEDNWAIPLTHEENGKVMEPMEKVFLDIPDDKVGVITEKLSERKGRMTNLVNHGHGRVSMDFMIPSRGLIGFRSQFLTDTRGAGIMNKLFDGYAPWFGPIPQRNSGAMVADRKGRVTTYACLGMVDRGELFVEVGTEVYDGMIIGERNRTEDLTLNITREKKLTNMRAAASDSTVVLRPPKQLSLDQSIEFIAEDELVEVTPLSIRLRKMELDPHKRLAASRKAKYGG